MYRAISFSNNCLLRYCFSYDFTQVTQTETKMFIKKQTIIVCILKDEDLQSTEQEALEKNRELPAVNTDGDASVRSRNNENSVVEAKVEITAIVLEREDKRKKRTVKADYVSEEQGTPSPVMGFRKKYSPSVLPKKSCGRPPARVHCPYCGKYLTSPYLPQHIDTMHKKLKPQQATPSPVMGFRKKYSPSVLPKKSWGRPPARVHCPYCGKYLTSPYLSQHIDTVHKKRKPYWCERCGKKYSLKPSLRSHLRNVHGAAQI